MGFVSEPPGLMQNSPLFEIISLLGLFDRGNGLPAPLNFHPHPASRMGATEDKYIWQ